MAVATLYPSLETIMNLVRVHLNDWQAGATLTPGEGQITCDNSTQSPQTLPALNSAIRTLYRKLRNTGAPTLIKDNVQVTCPAISSVVNPPNAQVQCYLGFQGFYDGHTLQSSPVLPQDYLYPLNVEEQQPNNTSLSFKPMTRAPHGLPSLLQGFYNLVYEWRGDAIYLPGTLVPIVLNLRYKAAFPQFFDPAMDFTNTQIPVMDCEEYVAWETAYIISLALEGVTQASQSVQTLKAESDAALFDLKQAYVLQAQNTPYRRRSYGGE